MFIFIYQYVEISGNAGKMYTSNDRLNAAYKLN